MRKQLHIFLTAVMFYTRIPCPAWVDHSEEYLNKATLYLPLIGWITGGFSALIFWGSSLLLPISVGLLLAMTGSIWLTGAFHEDGLADVCDGFGGGWTKKQVLEIMKDSRIGTYGVVGIVLMLAIKFSALFSLPEHIIPAAFIAGHVVSRFSPVLITCFSRYARDDDSSKSRPVAKKKLNWIELIIAFLFASTPLVLFQSYQFGLLIIAAILTAVVLREYFHHKLDGYTGDCLGATQQISEVIIYLILSIPIWKFI